MNSIETTAMKIFHAYEDSYLDKERRKIFEELFDKYLLGVDVDGQMEPYEAMVALGRRNSAEFEKMVKTLRDQSLISD